MFQLDRRQAFNPSCPSGGTWYACGYGSQFVGCCRSQPCDNGCPAGNLEPASFEASAYSTFADQECDAGRWYTCAGTNPPFMGCCKSNPCTSGCPVNDLAAGHLSGNPALAAQFSPSSGSIAAATPSSTSSTGPLITSSPASSAATSINTPAPASHSTSTGAIVGGAVGGGLGFAILAGLFFFFYFRRRAAASKKSHQGEPSAMSEWPKHGPATETYPSPAPLYSPYHETNPAFQASPNLPSHPSFSPVDAQSKSAVNPQYMGLGFPTIDAGTPSNLSRQTEHFELGDGRVLHAELEGSASPTLRGVKQ